MYVCHKCTIILSYFKILLKQIWHWVLFACACMHAIFIYYYLSRIWGFCTTCLIMLVKQNLVKTSKCILAKQNLVITSKYCIHNAAGRKCYCTVKQNWFKTSKINYIYKLEEKQWKGHSNSRGEILLMWMGKERLEDCLLQNWKVEWIWKGYTW
jgi:hypothetical protein